MPDWGDDREKPPTGVGRQPIQPTAAQQAAWREMGREKFRDPEHQRFAQSHRSPRACGRRDGKATSPRRNGTGATMPPTSSPTTGARHRHAPNAR